MFSQKTYRGEDTVEVNLVPFIDLLSVCICFLLLTAVWVQTEVMSTKQGLGTEATVNDNSKTLWVELGDSDTVVVTTKQASQVKESKKVTIDNLKTYALQIKKESPDLKTALVLPSVSTSYSNLIKAMNSLKKAEFSDIGISPL